MKLKVTKIIHRAMNPNHEGRWPVWCQVYVNGNYRYECLDFSSYDESKELKEGMFVSL